MSLMSEVSDQDVRTLLIQVNTWQDILQDIERLTTFISGRQKNLHDVKLEIRMGDNHPFLQYTAKELDSQLERNYITKREYLARAATARSQLRTLLDILEQKTIGTVEEQLFKGLRAIDLSQPSAADQIKLEIGRWKGLRLELEEIPGEVCHARATNGDRFCHQTGTSAPIIICGRTREEHRRRHIFVPPPPDTICHPHKPVPRVPPQNRTNGEPRVGEEPQIISHLVRPSDTIGHSHPRTDNHPGTLSCHAKIKTQPRGCHRKVMKKNPSFCTKKHEASGCGRGNLCMVHGGRSAPEHPRVKDT